MAKAGVRAVFGVRSYDVMATGMQPLLDKLDVSVATDLYQRKVLLFVHRCLNSCASTLFSSYFSLTANQANSTHRTTRGMETNLLCVPFLPGPAGRGSIRFRGSLLWNELPGIARQATCKSAFLRLI